MQNRCVLYSQTNIFARFSHPSLGCVLYKCAYYIWIFTVLPHTASTPWARKNVPLCFCLEVLGFLINICNFCTISNTNEYSAKEIQNTWLHFNCVSTLPSKTKNSSWTYDSFLWDISSNWCFKTFVESSSVFLFYNFFPVFLEIFLNNFTGRKSYIPTGFLIKNLPAKVNA